MKSCFACGCLWFLEACVSKDSVLGEGSRDRDVRAQGFLESGILKQKRFFFFFQKHILKRGLTALPFPASVSLLLLSQWCKEAAPGRAPPHFPVPQKYRINGIALPAYRIFANERLNLFCILISQCVNNCFIVRWELQAVKHKM